METTMPKPVEVTADNVAEKVKRLIEQNDLDPSEVLHKTRKLFCAEIDKEHDEMNRRFAVLSELKSRLHTFEQ